MHQAAAKGTLSNLSGVTAELLANVKDNDGWTPLHAAANHGHLDQIPSLTAEFLATVKDNDGWTPLDRAAKQNQLAQITDFTITLATTLNILSASLTDRVIRICFLHARPPVLSAARVNYPPSLAPPSLTTGRTTTARMGKHEARSSALRIAGHLL